MPQSVARILDVISRLRRARTFQEKMDLIAEGIAACGWGRVHLYVFDTDRKTIKSAAYWGIDEEGRRYLETHRMTLDEIEAILSNPASKKYRIGRCYYIPHDCEEGIFAQMHGTGLRSERSPEEYDGWHPDDMLFIPLYGFGGKAVGIVSVDDPVDGKKPTEESLRPVEMFVDYAIAYIGESELEEYLSKSRTMLSQVFNLSPVAIVVSDEQDRIIQINPAAEKMFGCKLEDLWGKETAVLFSNTTNIHDIIKKRGEGIFKGEVMMRRKDGKEFWAYVVAVPVMNLANEVEGHLLIALDVTEIKNLQYYLIRAEKMAGIGVLASGIAHELNNPLYGILGLAEAIVEEEDMDLIKEYANDIIEYAREAAEIVKDLSGYTYTSRMETASTVDVNATIQNAVKMIKRLGKLDNIEVVEDYGDIPEINASSGELQQVFVNLITNAVDSMPNGGKLFISTRRVGDFVEARVRDTGTGIRPEHRPHIFEPFFTTKQVGEGTGLGLYICYRIVNKYKGTIDFETEEGKGTTFIVRFPVNPDAGLQRHG